MIIQDQGIKLVIGVAGSGKMNGDIKIGKLLCDEDIITKRQLNQALQVQIKGDKRALGEILVDKGVCTLDDITDALMDEPQHKVEEEVVEKVLNYSLHI